MWLQLQKHALESVGIDINSLRESGEHDKIAEFTMRNLSRELVEMMKFYARVDPEDGATLRLNNCLLYTSRCV